MRVELQSEILIGKVESSKDDLLMFLDIFKAALEVVEKSSNNLKARCGLTNLCGVSCDCVITNEAVRSIRISNPERTKEKRNQSLSFSQKTRGKAKKKRIQSSHY